MILNSPKHGLHGGHGVRRWLRANAGRRRQGRHLDNDRIRNEVGYFFSLALMQARFSDANHRKVYRILPTFPLAHLASSKFALREWSQGLPGLRDQPSQDAQGQRLIDEGPLLSLD